MLVPAIWGGMTPWDSTPVTPTAGEALHAHTLGVVATARYAHHHGVCGGASSMGLSRTRRLWRRLTRWVRPAAGAGPQLVPGRV